MKNKNNPDALFFELKRELGHKLRSTGKASTSTLYKARQEAKNCTKIIKKLTR